MDINIQGSVCRTAVAMPVAIPIFERHRIRYFSASSGDLLEACRESEAPFTQVRDELEKALGRGDAQEGRWDHAPLPALVRYILDNHHTYERERLDAIQKQFEKVTVDRGKEYPELVELQSQFVHMAERLLGHMRIEEKDLFPHFRAEVGPGAGESRRAETAGRLLPLTDILEKDHDVLLDQWARMRIVSKGFGPPDGVYGPVQDLMSALQLLERYQHQHIHKENFILFEKIRSLSV